MADEHTPESGKAWGRIYMGDRVAELSDVERRRSNAWTEQDEADYLAKVRQKAQDMAKEILAKAERDAAALREQAAQEGYAEGIKQAEAELAELRGSMGDTVQAVLGAIQDQSGELIKHWKDDLAALVRLAVEKALAVTLDQDRAKVLEGLFTQAVQALENSRSIVVRCNPEDAAAVEDIINLGSEKYPELAKWKVIGDASVTPGGILVESESSLADNSIESRQAAVMKALETITLPKN